MLRKKISILARIEMVLLRLVVLVFVVFFISQVFMTQNPLERIVTVFEGFDGIGFHNDANVPALEGETNASTDEIANQQGEITLALVNYSSLQKAKVLVNGKSVGTFLNKYVLVNVKEGDILEIDGTFYNHPIKVEVYETEPAVKGLKEGQKFTVKKEILTLTEINFKQNKVKTTDLPVPGI